jgi:transcriptional regulator
MYQPAHFKEDSVETLHALITEFPLGALVTHAAGELTADHIPFEIDPAPAPFGTLRAHVARANPVWQHAAGQPVMVLFRSANGYISPGWYPSKQAHGKVVPTWNYAVVHAHGTLQVHEDAEWLHALVSRLTAHHERSQDRPWHVTDAPTDYIDNMLTAIVGIEIPITRIEGKWKMSQNRSASDRGGVIAGLQGINSDDARMMSTLVPDPFDAP